MQWGICFHAHKMFAHDYVRTYVDALTNCFIEQVNPIKTNTQRPWSVLKLTWDKDFRNQSYGFVQHAWGQDNLIGLKIFNKNIFKKLFSILTNKTHPSTVHSTNQLVNNKKINDLKYNRLLDYFYWLFLGSLNLFSESWGLIIAMLVIKLFFL